MVAFLFLKNQPNSEYRLRTLDLTGLPLSNYLVKKMLTKDLHFANQDLDMSNFSDLDDVSDFFSSEEDSWSSCSEVDSEIESFSMHSSFNDRDMDGAKIHNIGSWEKKSWIKLDLILSSSNLKENFVKLVQSKNETANLELKFNRIDLTIRDKKSFILNENFDSDALKIMGLGIFFNANLNEAMYTFNLVNKFSNVIELNLSAFGQESYLSCLLDHTCALDALSNCLTELKHLKRLRLNIPGCKNRLGYILANLTCPLEYLNLTSCGLGEQDLDFLANSMHTQSINNLVLSNNDLGNQCNAVIRLLRKMASNMQILDLGCNSFQFDAYFKIVNEVIVKMDNLRMLVTLDTMLKHWSESSARTMPHAQSKLPSMILT
ncbi:Leucine-rich repeat-containing 14 sw [Brachionus plicatilis]|uniref:Leucine-rich repeat-containing 14 sw n=1 Tax=Brachionus plicatilis TaxID=10195 RepID=A0A3M7SFQ1_BRAPC|nr:Leucine-rich repeat-containing 14 sw [Brachionus plicatilis]